MDIKRVAIVVGGGRGIGLATGKLLRENGWQVVLADRDRSHDANGSDFDVRTVDIGCSESSNRLVADVLAAHGQIDGLINAAGYNCHEAVADLNDTTWQDLFDIHLGGVLRMCRATYPALSVSAVGSVVNFSSIGARIGRPRRGPYAAAKAGVEALTRTLAIEWAPSGIRVNAIVPGIINTRLVQDNIRAGRVDENTLLRAIPLKRMGEAEEIAAAVEFLLSWRASYITGQSLVVDGGALSNGEW